MSSTVFVNSVTLTSAPWFQDMDSVAYQYLTSVSGGNTITAVGPSGLGAYAAGLKFRFIPAVTNTAAATINITGASALGARNIYYNGAACVGGELVIGIPTEITDDGTRFHITSLIAPPMFTSAETAIPVAGTTTTLAHGLLTVPRTVAVVIRNKTTEFGYAVNDESIILPGTINGVTVYADTTNIGIVLGNASAIQIARRDTFAIASITAANWKYVARAWR